MAVHEQSPSALADQTGTIVYGWWWRWWRYGGLVCPNFWFGYGYLSPYNTYSVQILNVYSSGSDGGKGVSNFEIGPSFNFMNCRD